MANQAQASTKSPCSKRARSLKQSLTAGLRVVVAGGTLMAAPWAWSAEALPKPSEQVKAPISLAMAEESVLIATRKALEEAEASAEAATQEALEPISRWSEFSPELADPEPPQAAPKNTPPTASTKPAKPESSQASKAPVKVASRPKIEAKAAAKTEPAKKFAPADFAGDIARSYAATTNEGPSRFRGLQAGVSTKKELLATWGEADETAPTKQGEVLSYKIKPFAGVDVLVEEGKVELIKVALERRESVRDLAVRLNVGKFKSAEIVDELSGDQLGVTYPEKGLLLLLAKPSDITPKATQHVTHIVLQSPDAEAFALRAEQRASNAPSARISDLKQALKCDPNNAYANWLLSKTYLETGLADSAEKVASAASKAQPKSDAYRLRWAEALHAQGEYDQAVLETRKVLDSSTAPQVVKAEALYQMGLLAAVADAPIAEKAIGFHTMAIDAADKLTNSKDAVERRRAKHLLVDAHLAVAKEISRRSYARKAEIVGQWVGRASGLSEEMIESGDGTLELRLQVAIDALEALSSLKPAKDPGPWIKEASETATKLQAANKDTMYNHRIEWQLGKAYFHALRIEHARRESDLAIKYGEQAIDHLAIGSATGEVRPEAEQLVGRLYFHLGAVYAVHKQNHAEAVQWYDKASPLLTSSSAPKTELAVPRRQGEALVSMAVSYWEEDQKPRAVELTEAGASLMEQAVAGGVLEESSLAVPYGNLSTMHKKLGAREESAKFAKLARVARASDTGSNADELKTARPATTKPRVASKSQPSTSSANTTRRTNSANQNRTGQNRAGQTRTGQQPNRKVTTSRQRTASTTNAASQQKTSSKPKSRRQSTRKTLFR